MTYPLRQLFVFVGLVASVCGCLRFVDSLVDHENLGARVILVIYFGAILSGILCFSIFGLWRLSAEIVKHFERKD